MAATFDGPNRIITLAVGETEVAVKAIYSDWKRWASTGDNLKFPPAFRVVGGDPLGGGVFLAGYYFLNNVAGWRIRPAAADQLTVLSGNLYAEDPGVALFASVAGDFSSTVALTRANASEAVSTSGSGSSAPTAAANAQAVWARALEGEFTAEQMMRLMVAALAGKVSGAAGSTVSFRDLADTRDRIVATVDENGNRTAVVRDAAP